MATAALSPSSSSPPPLLPSPTTSGSSAPPPNARVPGHSSYKNQLQQYTHRSAIPPPVYQTVNEGAIHAPRFVSSVTVDGMVFKSSNVFAHRKAAEQEAAMIALEGVAVKVKQEGCTLVREDPAFCKSILYEYAKKMKIPLPTYTNSQLKGLLPVFVCTVVFNGNTYSGDPRRNKKEAEQFAARTVIEEILGSSSSGSLMSQIIKSKGKLYASIGTTSVAMSSQPCNPPLGGLPDSNSKKRKCPEVTNALIHVPNNNHKKEASVSTAINPLQCEARKLKEESTCNLEVPSFPSQLQDSLLVESSDVCPDGANKKRCTFAKDTVESPNEEQ